MKHICALCGYVYKISEGDVENGIPAETYFEDLPSDWVCPLCGASKEDFDVVEDDDIEDDEF